MFDVDDFLAACVEAGRADRPHLAVKELLERAVSDPGAMAAALPPERAGIVPLHVAPDLTVLHVVWSPGLSFAPHEHRMWAAIGLYSGGEDNAFFRRDGATIAPSGGKELRTGDVVLLGGDTIHSVVNPTAEHAGAIHVYGGALLDATRSEWRGDPLTEEPYDVERAFATFEAANAGT